jgi:hypothetical protein
MLHAALLAITAACGELPPETPVGVGARPLVPAIAVAPADPDSLAVALHTAGEAWPTFRTNIRARREGWDAIIGRAQVSAGLVARARAAGGSWRLVAVAVDRCGDSMNSLPYVAALADSVPSVSLRIVPPAEGRALQAAFRSLDGRVATPTFVLLDAGGRVAGCIVELPEPLRVWSQEARTRGESLDVIHTHQRHWYEVDRGRGITTELVELLEGAAAGTPRCATGTAGDGG